eukprot:TRINITY_DN30452_c0_g1_i1.p1 TRINITY_DN30452_c0_g1~~TRINITY_DN30452_c0_g1_i1.p1  ORF type:complete len:798 (+),score=153.45 TRINITY_DN30452_c0_g1_i1:79-2472(+)
MVLITSRNNRDVVGQCFVFGTGAVAPGTYDIPRELGEISPTFGVGKRPEAGQTGSHTKTPGPGTYAIRRAASESAITVTKVTGGVDLGGSGFRFTKGRCTRHNWKEPLVVPNSSVWTPSDAAFNPGPGTYNPAAGCGAVRVKRPDTGSVWDERPLGKGEVRGTRLHTQSQPSIPLLPAKLPVNQLHTGKDADTPDPGDYSMEAISIGRQATSVDFGVLSGSRAFPPKYIARLATPGPGTYDHIVTPQPTDSVPREKLPAGSGGGGPAVPHPGFNVGGEMRSTAQPFVSSSCSPQFSPGPGSYNFPSLLESGKEVEAAVQAKRDAGEEHPELLTSPVPGMKPLANMRSTQAREGWWRPAKTPYTDPDSMRNPGPGNYQCDYSIFPTGKAQRARSTIEGDRKRYHGVINPTQYAYVKHTDAVPLVGFSCSEERMAMPRQRPHPDPTTYDRDGALGQSISANLREQEKVGRGGAFGSTKDGERFPRDRSIGPDPGDYQSKIADPPVEKSEAGGSFRSREMRIPRDHTVDHGPKPDPTAYDLPSAFNPADTRTSYFRKPNKDNVCFNTSSDRFYVREAVGPPLGAYDAERPTTHMANFWGRSTEERWKPAQKDSTAGQDPGTYNIAKSLLRKTFNTSQNAAIVFQHSQSEVKTKLPPPQGPFIHKESSWRPRQVIEAEEAARAAEAEFQAQMAAQAEIAAQAQLAEQAAAAEVASAAATSADVPVATEVDAAKAAEPWAADAEVKEAAGSPATAEAAPADADVQPPADTEAQPPAETSQEVPAEASQEAADAGATAEPAAE